MTSQGTAHGRFTRAIRDRHIRLAEMAAREMGELALADALDFCLLLAEADPERWPRASARWLGRLIIESPAITLNEVMLAAAAMQGLQGPDATLARQTLRALAARHGQSTVVALLGRRSKAASLERRAP
jgi:hypothetical protein